MTAHAAEMPVPGGAFLSAMGPAGRRSLGINATPSDHLPHHRIKRRTVRVVHIIISGQSPEDRLPQKPDHGMQTVVDASRISERTAGNIVQSRGLVQLPERQRATVGTDLRAMAFQLHPTVETEPDITRFACTLRVIRPLQPAQNAEI